MLSHFFGRPLILLLPIYLTACSMSQAISPQKSEVLAQGNKFPKATTQATKPKQLTARDVEIAEQKSYEVAIKQLQTIPKENPPRTQQDVEVLLRHREQVIAMLQSCTNRVKQVDMRNPKLTQEDYGNLINYLEFYAKRMEFARVHKVAEGKRLVFFSCGGGAYQSPSVLFLHIETSGKPLLKPLNLTYFERDARTGRVVEHRPFKSNVFDGMLIPNKEDSQRFNILYRGRGIGDCGVLWFYKVVDNNFVLEKIKAHPECDGKLTPFNYPQVYP